jgi:hypothetical protein
MNMMWRFSVIAMLLVTCGGAGTDTVVGKVDTNAVTLSSQVTSVELIVLSTEDSARMRLQEYFLNPCDLPRIKDNMDLLEMGNVLPKKYMHLKDSGLYNYNYGAVAGLIKNCSTRDLFHPGFESLSPTERLISFSTYKPWKTQKDRDKNNDNEILVGIETIIGHPYLEPGDFIGIKSDSIVRRFGVADTSRQSCAVYLEQNHVLVLHEKNTRIDWFKMYWLHDTITKPEQLPEQLFRWN